MVIGPAWTRGEIEKPAGVEDRGSFQVLVYTAEQQARLGVDKEGKKVASSTPQVILTQPQVASVAIPARPSLGQSCKAIGPAWTRREIEPPAGTKDMGGWTAGVYTAEQQQRLGVDETGNKIGAASAAVTPALPARPPVTSTCRAVGPTWTRGEIERPAGTKDMGGWTAGVYTSEQQQRLGVDETGNKVGGASAAVTPAQPARPPVTSMCRAIGPAWTRGEIESPAGTNDMGGWTAGVYTPEQQQRLRVDEMGNKVEVAAPAPVAGMCGAIGPAWTRGEIEAPAGSKDMGSYTIKVYTEEQQERLGVDETGVKIGEVSSASSMPSAVVIGGGGPLSTVPRMCGAIGPAWTRGEIEKPAGSKNMGSWTAAVYTPEQQQRLGVDEFGSIVATADKAPDGALPQAMSSGDVADSTQPPPTITPQYARALLSSPKLLDSLCKQYFKKYDANSDNILELSEIHSLCHDLHLSLGMSLGEIDDESIKNSILPHSQDGANDKLRTDEFPGWFEAIMKESIDAHVANPETSSGSKAATVSLTVKTLSGRQETLQVALDLTVAAFRETVATALEMPVAQTQLMLGEQILPEGPATLASVGIAADAELSAVVSNSIKVKRHVYNMRGGAPPYRGYHLVASDEVELFPSQKLGEQWSSIVPDDGYPGRPNARQTAVYAFQSTIDGAAPKMWSGGHNEVEVGADTDPGETFGVDGLVEMAVLVPMRGMD